MSNSTNPSLLPRWKRLTFSLISIISGLVLSLVAAEAILRYQRHYIERSDQIEAGIMLYDRQLGWRLTPDWQGSHHHYDFDTHYQINHFGFRGTPEQESNRPTEAKHFVIVGDSFTFGTGVNYSDTFAQQLNLLGNGEKFFTNYGVPGYSTDQEYLLIKETIRPLKPNHIILVVYLGNDLFDNELAFPMQAENSKPFFRLDANGQLEKKNSPVPMQSKPAAARQKNLHNIVMGELNFENSFLEKTMGNLEIFRRLGLFQSQPKISTDYFEKRFAHTLQLFYALVSAIEADTKEVKADLSIVLLPGRSAIARPESVSAQYQTYLGNKIVKQFSKQSEIQVIDLLAPLTTEFQKQNTKLYFSNEGHLTPNGHQVVAAEIIKALLKAEH